MVSQRVVLFNDTMAANIAGIDRFDGLPPQHHPASIFPEARSVIVLGRRITRGTLRGVEEGTQFSNYRLYGYDWLDNRFVAMTVYRDQGDAYVSRTFEFTPDVDAFEEALAEVRADGGGDYPEDLNEALSRAVHAPEWRVEETVSLIFLVADAPPHLDYGQQNHYAFEMLAAAERGIKIYPIASSGLDDQGEYIFRQIAQYTQGRFIFLTYAGATNGGPVGSPALPASRRASSDVSRPILRIRATTM